MSESNRKYGVVFKWRIIWDHYNNKEMSLEEYESIINFDLEDLIFTLPPSKAVELKEVTDKEFVSPPDDNGMFGLYNENSSLEDSLEQRSIQIVPSPLQSFQEEQSPTTPNEIIELENENDNSADIYDPIKEKKTKRTKNTQRNGHPTKNFLVNFKNSHTNFLVEFLGEQVLEHPLIKGLKKHGINMKDYERLYLVEEFKEAFESYFSKRVIYRDLMQSRVTFERKKIYLARLPIFEQSFRNGKFDHIN